MKMVSGIAVGAGTSAMYIGLGFTPDQVTLRALTATTLGQLVWNRQMVRNSICPEGLLFSTDNKTALADGAGIELYYGGDIITTASANQVAHVSHPALVATYGKDQRLNAVTGKQITKALVTTDAATKIHVDAALDTTYVGVGSRVLVQPTDKSPVREFAIAALSNDGQTVDDITLNNAHVAGDIRFISYKYDYANLPVGYAMPAGIRINETSLFNNSGVLFVIEAIQW